MYISNTSRYTNRSMQLIVKRLGHNLIILPDSTNPLDLYWCTDKQTTASEEVTAFLAGHGKLASRYFVGVLQSRIELKGKSYLLTGIEPVQRADESAEKGNMIRPVPEGTVRLGCMAAQQLGCSKGTTLLLKGTPYTVESVAKEMGDMDDYRVYLPLKTVQALTGQQGRIHYILAFLCQHSNDVDKSIERERLFLKQLVPEMTMVAKSNLIQGRALARQTTDKTLYYLLGLILVVTLMIIVISGSQEIAERRKETGILASMGAGYGYILSLYLIKIGILSLLASFSGFLLGSALAVHWTSGFLVTETAAVSFQWADFPLIAAVTLVTALVAESVPLLGLLRSAPSDILMEE
ncbi:MAG: FtsX-like permease family protein [Fibrobacteres bacterium]|nr:FtsX-like permease family protein [Fibrobacterota bacterium]